MWINLFKLYLCYIYCIRNIKIFNANSHYDLRPLLTKHMENYELSTYKLFYNSYHNFLFDRVRCRRALVSV